VDGVEGISFADDVGWWVSGKDIGEIRRKIEECASLSRQWAQNNAVVFDIDKTEIVLLSRRRKMNRASKEGIQVAAVQAVALYGAELWWDETKNHSRTTDLQKLVNRQSRSITGMLRTTPIGPLVKEAGLRSADSL
jgi:hypothetical protein